VRRIAKQGLLTLAWVSALSLTLLSVTAQAAPNRPDAAAATCSVGQVLSNPGFETGSAAPWKTTSGVINSNGNGETAHSGNYFAWLDGYGTTHTDTLSQQVSIPAGCHAILFFWLHIDTAETTTTIAYDKLTLAANGTTIGNWSNLNANTGYAQKGFDLSAYAGQTVTILFTGSEDYEKQTSFVIDDAALQLI
jgi:hypothetical protein